MRSARVALFALVLAGCRRPEPTIVQMSMSATQSCAVTKHRELHCWGGPAPADWHPRLVAKEGVDEVAVGTSFRCTRSTESVRCTHRPDVMHGGRVYAVGNRVCLLSNGVFSCAIDAAPLVELGRGVEDAAIVPEATLLRMQGGSVKLLRTGHDERSLPTLQGAVSLALTGAGYCGVLASKEVYCAEGLEGTPVQLPIVRATAVTMQDAFTCLRTVDARLACRGTLAGQRYDGVTAMFGLFGVTSVTSNPEGVCAALGITEGARCIGDNAHGTLGVPQARVSVPMPVRFPR